MRLYQELRDRMGLSARTRDLDRLKCSRFAHTKADTSTFLMGGAVESTADESAVFCRAADAVSP